jgi:hypothetical protein
MAALYFSMHGNTSLTQAHVQRVQPVQRVLTPLRRGVFSNTILGCLHYNTTGFATLLTPLGQYVLR